MNIKDAKEEIRNAIFAYFTKNEFDEYEIPIEKQRPIFWWDRRYWKNHHYGADPRSLV